MNNLPTHSDFSRKYERDRQQEDYRKDIVQPFDEDYVKVYGAQQAHDRGWSDEDIRKHG